MSATQHYVPTADGHVFVEVDGEAGELVLIATGGPGASHDHYHPWFSNLLPEFRVAYIDYIGCGLSAGLDEPDGYSVELFGRNLEAICDRLQEATVSVIGVSFGGFPAVDFALNNGERVRRLVLSNAQVTAAAWQRTNIDGVNAELARLFPDAWTEILELREAGVTSLDDRYQELIGRVLPDLEWVDPWNHPRLNRPPHDHGFELAVYTGIVGPDPEWDVTGTLAGYDRSGEFGRLPETLVLSGRYDRLTPPEVADQIYASLEPACRRLHIFERSAHRPWVEEPDQYFATVKAFLDGGNQPTREGDD
jgi:proline iminopeptidase